MNKEEQPIGIIDSGVGGLTIVYELIKNLPEEKFIYIADTANIPYGEKSNTQLQNYAIKIVDFLLENNVKAIVVACGTLSSVALSMMQEYCTIPVIGVISSGAKSAVKITRNNRIGIIATRASIKSNKYKDSIMKINNNCETFQNECSKFVPLIENGELYSVKMNNAILEYINPLLENGIDTLVLGCTHYPYIKKSIKEFVGNNVELIDVSHETINELDQVLINQNIKSKSSSFVNKYYVTGDPIRFIKSIELLGLDFVDGVEKINLFNWLQREDN